MLRSTDFGTYWVHHRLNCWRAITLCCTAKTDIRRMSMMSVSLIGAAAPESMVLGTTKPDTKPMA